MKKQYTRLYSHSEKHISFKKFLLTCGFSIVLSILVYILTKVLWFYPDKTAFYLVYVIAVALGAWLGGLLGGFLTAGLITIEAFFLFQPPILELSAFLITASIVSFFINSSLRAKEIQRLKKQEKIYSQTFLQLYDDYVKAKEEIKARDEFLSIASHELKTPLTTMLIKLHNMVNNIQNVSLAHFSIPELMKVLENAEQQIKLLAKMINDLLNVSLITTGHMNLEYTDCDLVKITKYVTQSFSELLKNEKYKLKVYSKSPVIGSWDKARIEQAITNLLSNAIKYGQGKPITIKVQNSGAFGKLIIEDHGIGIEHKDQKILFDRFKRAVSSKEHKKGLGVGLYITYQIVKAHGGTIKINSKPTKGSTFSMELPLNKNKS